MVKKVLIALFVIALLFVFRLYFPKDSAKVIKQVHSYGWSETTYKDGKKNGIYKDYWKDGTLLAQINYVDDKVDGVFKRFYKNGNLLEETHFKLGVKQGSLKRYDESGKLTQNDVYQNGLLLEENNSPFTGVKKEYYEGDSWQENEYKDGKEHGISKTFRGQDLMFERKFEEGKLMAYRAVSKEMNGSQEWSPVSIPKNDAK